MNGVIIFADDKVFENGSFENKLYENLTSDGVPVLPISDLRTLETTIKSMSTFKALILDWNFKGDNGGVEELEGAELPPVTPEMVLDNLNIYSLIYVYSQVEIDEETKSTLKTEFPNKVKFETKVNNSKKTISDIASEEAEKIAKDIKEFEDSNNHMEIPFKWSQAINQSVQKIFAELEQATPNWVKEIGETAKKDGGEPVSEIINIFNNILSESLIQNDELRKLINNKTNFEQVSSGKTDTERENTAKLYRRIFYSKITTDAPFATGDIFKFDDNIYGILVTPECMISKRNTLDFLVIEKDGFKKYVSHKYNYTNFDITKLKNKTKNELKESFNNNEISAHILPSFPFGDGINNMPAYINFKEAISIKEKEEVTKERIGYKLNSPYIHQLRQRFVSYFGRYGVPAIPESLSDYNLNSL